MILILTNKLDVGADWVVRELVERHSVVLRLNTEDLAETLVRWQARDECEIATPQRRFLASEVTAIWYRRPGRPFGDRLMQDSPAYVLNSQWRAFLTGVLYDLPKVRWINHPELNARAESKVRQLRAASACGLRVPETVITNSSEVARMAADKWTEGAVIKALDAPLVVKERREQFVFTTRIRRRHLQDPEAFSMAPVIVQQRIAPRIDVRVTVVDNHAFAARAQKVGRQDWRLERRRVIFVPFDLPRRLQAQCVELVGSMGLRFGAIDLVRTPNAYYFLEINPNGEWGWLQKVGLPIAQAIADALVGSN